MTSTRSIPFILYFFLLAFVGSTYADSIESNGVVYRSITEIASKLGMKSQWDFSRDRQILSSKWTEIIFRNRSRIIELNSTKIYLGYPIIKKSNRLYIPELDWQFTLSPILLPQKYHSRYDSIRTIVLDPGHGGKDPGARSLSHDLNEKDLTLKVARYLSVLLRKKGYRVYLVRKNDRYVELKDRVRYAKKKSCDLFISIHFNSSENSGASGIETYAYTLLNQPSTSRSMADSADRIFRRANRNDSKNILLAYHLQKELLLKSSEKDRGVKRARFTVLEELQCPGALVELGFINNTETVRHLKSNNYLKQLALRLSSGISQFEKRMNPSKS